MIPTVGCPAVLKYVCVDAADNNGHAGGLATLPVLAVCNEVHDNAHVRNQLAVQLRLLGDEPRPRVVAMLVSK